MIYEWKRNMAVKAQEAGEYLESLERKYSKITPKLIVDDSRSEEALLHKCFEWNNEQAAEKYRENQAGFMLRNLVSVNVSQTGEFEGTEIRAFVNVATNNSTGFVSVLTAMNNNDMRDQILQEALSELLALKKKYSQLKELAEVFKALEGVK